jgi:hypothetical protein
MRRTILVSLAIIALAITSLSARSSQLALDFTGTLQNAFVADLTFGWSFTANQALMVDGLGFFDDEIVDGQGLQQDHLVSLWTDTGTLLGSTTISNASTAVASTAADGRWLFNDIAPVLLTAGNDYVIGAHDPASSGCAACDRIRYFDTATTTSEITFIQALDGVGNGFPTGPVPDRNDGYFGPNLRVNPVPVPAAAWLFGTALVGFFGMSRRRKVT